MIMIKRIKWFFVFMMLMIGTSVSAADYETLFYNASHDDIVFHYKEGFSIYQTGALEIVNNKGILALKEIDLDGDEQSELLVIAIMEDDNGQFNKLRADVYGLKDKKLKKLDSCVLASNLLSADETECNVFLMSKKKGYYICCEHRETDTIFEEEMKWNLQVKEYDSGFISEYGNAVIEGSKDAKANSQAKKLCSKIGLSKKTLLKEALVFQNNSRQIDICRISRSLDETRDDIISFMGSEDEDSIVAGNTTFESFCNSERENKMSSAFSTRKYPKASTQRLNAQTFCEDEDRTMAFVYDDMYGFYPPGKLEEVYYNGILAVMDADLDGDGEEELLVISIKKDEVGGNSMLTADIYSSYAGDIVQNATYTLATGVLMSEEVDCTVFLIKKKKGYYLCCEDKEQEKVIRTDLNWQLRVAEYDGESFHEVANVYVDKDKKKKAMNAAADICKKLGFSEKRMLTEALGNQENDHMTLICTIFRQATFSKDELLSHFNSGDGSAYYYGYTAFESKVNKGFTVKNINQFGSRAAITSDGQTSEGQTSEGQTQKVPKQKKTKEDIEVEDEERPSASEFPQGVVSDDLFLFDEREQNAEAGGYSDEYVIPDSSSRYLSESDLEKLSYEQLRIARNEIYARKGRRFQDAALQQYFDNKSWYRGKISPEAFDYEYAASVLNDYEIYNIELIRGYENLLKSN